MLHVLKKSFGSISREYYLRSLFFGSVIFFVSFFWILEVSRVKYEDAPWGVVALMLLSTFLYPYSRMVYENIIGFISGDNHFVCDAKLFLFTKIISMGICWGFAIFIAPFGLAYLYFKSR